MTLEIRNPSLLITHFKAVTLTVLAVEATSKRRLKKAFDTGEPSISQPTLQGTESRASDVQPFWVFSKTYTYSASGQHN